MKTVLNVPVKIDYKERGGKGTTTKDGTKKKSFLSKSFRFPKRTQKKPQSVSTPKKPQDKKAHTQSQTTIYSPNSHNPDTAVNPTY